jgi:hypothetical protein
LPISIKNLSSTKGVLPPEFKKQRGRPLTKRIRKGAWKRGALHCSNCNGTGHNIQKCRHTPALNGQQQRVRDQEESSLDKNSSSDLGSDIDNAVDEARVDQAELDLYDERIARAHEIVERRQAE